MGWTQACSTNASSHCLAPCSLDTAVSNFAFDRHIDSGCPYVRLAKELSGHLKNLGYDASQVVKF